MELLRLILFAKKEIYTIIANEWFLSIFLFILALFVLSGFVSTLFAIGGEPVSSAPLLIKAALVYFFTSFFIIILFGLVLGPAMLITALVASSLKVEDYPLCDESTIESYKRNSPNYSLIDNGYGDLFLLERSKNGPVCYYRSNPTPNNN